MISKQELEKWAFQLKTDGDCDATDKDIETIIYQMLCTMEELETAKRCLPVDKEFEVRGSWIGSVQNYIAHLEESLENASVGNALLERENHHAKVVGHLVDLITELKCTIENLKQELSESSGNAFKEAYESGHTRHVPDVVEIVEEPVYATLSVQEICKHVAEQRKQRQDELLELIRDYGNPFTGIYRSGIIFNKIEKMVKEHLS